MSTDSKSVLIDVVLSNPGKSIKVKLPVVEAGAVVTLILYIVKARELSGLLVVGIISKWSIKIWVTSFIIFKTSSPTKFGLRITRFNFVSLFFIYSFNFGNSSSKASSNNEEGVVTSSVLLFFSGKYIFISILLKLIFSKVLFFKSFKNNNRIESSLSLPSNNVYVLPLPEKP